MGSVNISLKEDAYEFLKSLKSEDRSFSDVVLGFKKSEGQNALRFFGVLKDANWKKKERAHKELRDEFEGRLR